MEQLKRAQRNCLRVLKQQISQVGDLCDNFNCNRDALSVEQIVLEPFLAQSSPTEHELLDAITDYAVHDQVFDQGPITQKAACQIIQAAKRRIAASSLPFNHVATMQIESTRSTSKLPQINLPCFSGDFTVWLNFINQFPSTAHDNDKLSPVQKLMYLKNCLTSHASDLIMNLEMTESNYEVALQCKSRDTKRIEPSLENFCHEFTDSLQFERRMSLNFVSYTQSSIRIRSPSRHSKGQYKRICGTRS